MFKSQNPLFPDSSRAVFVENQLFPFSMAPRDQTVDEYGYASDSDLEDDLEDSDGGTKGGQEADMNPDNTATGTPNRHGRIVGVGDVAYKTSVFPGSDGLHSLHSNLRQVTRSDPLHLHQPYSLCAFIQKYAERQDPHK